MCIPKHTHLQWSCIKPSFCSRPRPAQGQHVWHTHRYIRSVTVGVVYITMHVSDPFYCTGLMLLYLGHMHMVMKKWNNGRTIKCGVKLCSLTVSLSVCVCVRDRDRSACAHLWHRARLFSSPQGTHWPESAQSRAPFHGCCRDSRESLVANR